MLHCVSSRVFWTTQKVLMIINYFFFLNSVSYLLLNLKSKGFRIMPYPQCRRYWPEERNLKSGSVNSLHESNAQSFVFINSRAIILIIIIIPISLLYLEVSVG